MYGSYGLDQCLDLAETARMLAARGRGAITVAGEILAGKQEG